MGLYNQIKYFIFGAPLHRQRIEHEKLNIPLGLAVFSSDALSSTAYATDELLIALSGTYLSPSANFISLFIISLIILLVGIVILSYRQVIQEYPQGGGSYTVAKENLGVLPSHITAAALLTDYVLTVAVSVSAGIAAVTSTGVIPRSATVSLCILAVLFITTINLKGQKESGKILAVPVYIFLACILGLIITGLLQEPSSYILNKQETSKAGLDFSSVAFILIFLKAFSHGCVGLTGIEAVSDGVKAFKEPSYKRANTTMLIMGSLLSVIMFGTTYLAFKFQIMPKVGETMISQIAGQVFGYGSAYYYIMQFSTLVVLVLAANTAFADFPRIANILASDRFLPRQLMNIGDRLVLNNGIKMLGFFSLILIVAFRGDTHALIPMYAVGVFISFTITQVGIVVHHFREKEKGWKQKSLINGFGALVTALVMLLITYEKFFEGAWLIVVVIPIIVMMFRAIRSHYESIARQISLQHVTDFSSPSKQVVLVLVSSLSKVTLSALNYARSINPDIVEAVSVDLDPKATERLQKAWAEWTADIPLKILPSPYNSLIEPITTYLDELDALYPNTWITVIVPEFVTKKFWHYLLHNQTAFLLKAVLRFKRRKVVTTVRYYIDA